MFFQCLIWLVLLLWPTAPWVLAQLPPRSISNPEDEKPLGPDEWEALTRSGQILRSKLLTTAIELKTSYGPLKIPGKEIQSIDFGMRISTGDQKNIDTAIAAIVSGTNAEREQGKDAILELSTKAYPAVVRALESAPKDAAPHLLRLRDMLWSAGTEQDEPRDWDRVNTVDGSSFAGQIVQDHFQWQKGNESIEISRADLSQLIRGDKLERLPKYDLINLNQFSNCGATHMDKIVGIELTAAKGSTVWGDLRYTSDSSPITAAIHAGVLKEVETAIVLIKILSDPGAYGGSTRNGVTSNPYGRWHWSYQFVGKTKVKKAKRLR